MMSDQDAEQLQDDMRLLQRSIRRAIQHLHREQQIERYERWLAAKKTPSQRRKEKTA